MRYHYRQSYGYYKKPFYKTKGCYLLILLIIGISYFVYWSITKNQPDDENNTVNKEEKAPSLSAKLTNVSGKVESKTADGTWQEIGENYAINSGDAVKVGDGSKAIIELPEKSLIRLAANSEIKFIEMGMADITIEQISGKAYHRPYAQSTAVYKVKKENVELMALGTAFNVVVSSNLVILTVIENQVKIKVMDASGNPINMRSVDSNDTESGNQAMINPNLTGDKTIAMEKTTSSKLLSDEWYAWNINEDKKNNLSLGMFEQKLPLSISEPAEAEMTTAFEKIKIKGQTEKDAKIFIAGNELKNIDGQFEIEIPLQAGENKIEITAQKDKNISKQMLFITRTVEGTIKLTGKETETGKVTLSWVADKIPDFEGFAVIKGKDANPAYPAADSQLKDKNTFTAEWTNLAKETHHFRVCALKSSQCLTYSNDLSISLGDLVGDITLKASADKDSAKLSWVLSSDIAINEGWRTIISDKADPAYPANASHQIAEGKSEDLWKSLAAGTYNFRVCLIRNGACALYSNNATVTIKAENVSKISLSGKITDGVVNLDWTTQNVTADKGYLILLGTTAGVQSPAKDSHMITNASEKTNQWTGLESGTTYYFRACINTGSGCGLYSNEISLTMP